jgi:hypothetical protein
MGLGLETGAAGQWDFGRSYKYLLYRLELVALTPMVYIFTKEKLYGLTFEFRLLEIPEHL